MKNQKRLKIQHLNSRFNKNQITIQQNNTSYAQYTYDLQSNFIDEQMSIKNINIDKSKNKYYIEKDQIQNNYQSNLLKPRMIVQQIQLQNLKSSLNHLKIVNQKQNKINLIALYIFNSGYRLLSQSFRQIKKTFLKEYSSKKSHAHVQFKGIQQNFKISQQQQKQRIINLKNKTKKLKIKSFNIFLRNYINKNVLKIAFLLIKLHSQQRSFNFQYKNMVLNTNQQHRFVKKKALPHKILQQNNINNSTKLNNLNQSLQFVVLSNININGFDMKTIKKKDQKKIEVIRNGNMQFIQTIKIEKHQFTQTFLSIVKGSKSKNQFLKMIQQFDQKFTQSYTLANMINKPSFQSFQSKSQIDQHNDRSNNQFNMSNNLNMKPKNPFLKDLNDNNQQRIKNNYYSPKSRGNNFISPENQYNHNHFNQYNYNQNAMKMQLGKKTQNTNWNKNIQYSRSQQQFYKQQIPTNTYYGGFNQRAYEKNINDFNQIHQYKLNSQWGQDKMMANQGYNNHPNNNKLYQFQQLAKNFQNMYLKDQHNTNNMNNKFISANQMPSFTNQHPHASNSFDSQNKNQFLANLQKQQEPDFIKYYKKLVPSAQSKNNLHKQNQGPVFVDHRSNPFANKN